MEPENVSKESNGYVGKLRSNLTGSFYNLYHSFDLKKGVERDLLSVSYVAAGVTGRTLDCGGRGSHGS